MDQDIKLNSPRTLQACRIKGILPEELYYVEYKDYLSAHPEITNLPEDIKKYRFKLLEKLRQKSIEIIKVKRKELIDKEKNRNETDENRREKLTQNFNTNESEYGNSANLTFSEKMNKMITRERANIKKIKQKQKQNIEFMIEQQMKAELINYRNIEKEESDDKMNYNRINDSITINEDEKKNIILTENEEKEKN